MKYRDLLTKLQSLTPDQLECHVAVYSIPDDEMFGVDCVGFTLAPDNDVVDEDHPVITINNHGIKVSSDPEEESYTDILLYALRP